MLPGRIAVGGGICQKSNHSRFLISAGIPYENQPEKKMLVSDTLQKRKKVGREFKNPLINKKSKMVKIITRRYFFELSLEFGAKISYLKWALLPWFFWVKCQEFWQSFLAGEGGGKKNSLCFTPRWVFATWLFLFSDFQHFTKNNTLNPIVKIFSHII